MKQSVAKSLKSLIGIKSICSEVQMQDIEGLKRKLTNKLYVQCDGFVPDWKLGKMARLQQTQRKRVGIVPRLPVDVVAAIAAEVTRLIPSLLSPSVAQVPQKTHLIGITFIQFK
ncbi:uncharacterized protein LOC141687104 isoform X3 [Apium graveolens]|uniref:uncharacterized protein LOC141687104 isoform X3 n=1 Tax=Apium graveolens TaxID=4045 RepID=UPI003D791555